MAKKKQIDIQKYCQELIGKLVEYYYNNILGGFHGRIVRVRLEVLEEETQIKTLVSPNLCHLDKW